MVTNTLKKIFSSNVFKNGAWLYVLQIFNTLVPFLTLPYITRVMGSSSFGFFSFSLNIIGYFQVLVEYGFNLSASRKIAITNDKKEINRIFSSIMVIKLLLCFITFIVMFFIIILFDIKKEQSLTMFILYLLVVGSSIQQTWLFQGLQRMKYITIISVIARSISLILIFVFVKNADDLYLYSFLYAFTFLFSGIASLILVFKTLKIKFVLPSYQDIILELRDGWHTFTTSAMTKIFSGFGITTLGITSTEAAVGIYSAIQKIPLIISMMFAPISQAIFPYISKHYTDSFNKGLNKVKVIGLYVMPIIIFISLVLVVESESLVRILFGEEYAEYSFLLIPLTCWMFFSVLNNFLGIQILVASGYLKEYSTAFKLGLLALLIVNIVFGSIWGVFGIALAAFVGEFILSIALIYQIRKVILYEKVKGA
ncbi:oligosaccharide flippase family protein [Planococcus notacanthi]|uniref:oligosaccharide flippase family protein n=1 Tax=Planococcus notacanthi TaxID=3035188 RepID=UPI0025B299AD|nr:oligosaccharide flippase family protein [Planococcus sp. APC 4016]